MWWRRHGILWSCQTLAHNHHFSSSNCQILTQLYVGPPGTVSRSLTKKTIVQEAEREAKTHNKTIPGPSVRRREPDRNRHYSQFKVTRSFYPSLFRPTTPARANHMFNMSFFAAGGHVGWPRVLINREVKAGKNEHRRGQEVLGCVKTAQVEVKRQDQVL